MEAYLQESGRASRDGLGANAWLIVAPDDMANLDALGDLPDDAPEQPGVSRSQKAALVGDSSRQGAPGAAAVFPTPPTTSVPGTEAIAQARCTGFDVCGGETWTDPPEREVIQKMVRWNRGRFRK